MLQHSPPDKALVEQAYSKLQQMLRQVSTSQGQMLVEQGHKIQGLEKAVAAQEKVVADQGVKIDTMHSMLSDLHRALLPQAGAAASAVVCSPAPAPVSLSSAAPAPSCASTPVLGPAGSLTKSLPAPSTLPPASTPPKSPPAPPTNDTPPNALLMLHQAPLRSTPGFTTHVRLAAVYETFLHNKWTTPSDAAQWKPSHRSNGAKIYTWLHAIATEQERHILLGPTTGANGANILKVLDNLEVILMGIIYEIYTHYKLPVPKHVDYVKHSSTNSSTQFFKTELPLTTNWLFNRLKHVKSALADKSAVQSEFESLHYKSPPEFLVRHVKTTLQQKQCLKLYEGPAAGGGSGGGGGGGGGVGGSGAGAGAPLATIFLGHKRPIEQVNS